MLSESRNLAFACLHGNACKVVEILSCAGTLVNRPIYDEPAVYYGSTPLHSAAQGINDYAACQVLNILLAAGGDPTLLTPTDDEMAPNSWPHEDGSETPLMLAVRNRLEGAVALLLAHPTAQTVLNWKSDYSERTALHIAVEMPLCWDTDHRYAQTWNGVDGNPALAWSYVRIMLQLLMRGAQITARRRDYESTGSQRGDQPLHVALINTVNMNFEVMEVVVRLLLHYGAPANSYSSSGTPINLAVHCNNVCITRVVAAYAAVNTSNWRDWRHLASLACAYKNQRSATFFAAMMPQIVLQSTQTSRYSPYNYVRWLPGIIQISQNVQDRCLAVVRPRFCNHACAPKCVQQAALVCMLLCNRGSPQTFLPRELWFLILSFLPTPWSSAARSEIPCLPAWSL